MDVGCLQSRQDLMQLIVNAHNESVDVSEVAKELEQDGIKFEGNNSKQKGTYLHTEAKTESPPFLQMMFSNTFS